MAALGRARLAARSEEGAGGSREGQDKDDAACSHTASSVPEAASRGRAGIGQPNAAGQVGFAAGHDSRTEPSGLAGVVGEQPIRATS